MLRFKPPSRGVNWTVTGLDQSRRIPHCPEERNRGKRGGGSPRTHPGGDQRGQERQSSDRDSKGGGEKGTREEARGLGGGQPVRRWQNILESNTNFRRRLDEETKGRIEEALGIAAMWELSIGVSAARIGRMHWSEQNTRIHCCSGITTTLCLRVRTRPLQHSSPALARALVVQLCVLGPVVSGSQKQ